VRTLFDGKVIFSSWFRGYGEMIVIDHGDEYLSIYGQLGERLVEVGQEVRRDQPIARSGGEGTFGVTGLYLEIRHQGRAEDPRPWLRKGGAQAAGASRRNH
jgi:septal ring factor EnvC (AmiA/AmiB activator)